MIELLRLLEPFVGEIITGISSLLFAHLKKRHDKKIIKQCLREVLEEKKMDADTISDVVATIDSPSRKTK